LRSLLIEQFEIDPARLIPILHYDGTPITARFIARAIGERIGGAAVMPLRSDKVA
jgi:2-oxoglutarate ferredoxin oxidoreductase subunit alpha